jgi:catalase
MKRRQGSPGSWGGKPITRRGVVMGMAAVGGFLVVDLGAMLYARGPIGSGGRLTPQTFVDAFHRVYGRHPGYRLNHSKGVAVTGYFESNGAGAELTTAAVFRSGRTPLQGRFSLSGGNPNLTDAAGVARGLGLAIGFPGPQQWRMAMLNLPVFLDNSPQGFYDRLLASKNDPATGKPDPAAMKAFLAAHPETAKAMDVVKQHAPTAGFADSTFRSLNAFYFVNAAGNRTGVRWSLDPLQPLQTPPSASKNPDWLFDNLIRNMATGPLRWRLLLTIAEPGDNLRDATIAWPEQRRVVDTGTVVLERIETEAPGNARDINFDPMVLPSGIEPSEDPLLPARSAVYSASLRRRAGVSGAAPQVNVNGVAL